MLLCLYYPKALFGSGKKKNRKWDRFCGCLVKENKKKEG